MRVDATGKLLRITPRARVGLLGGSFNPAHQGHLHISRVALNKIRLDQVWWLVSPQNPLKSASGMAPLKDRMDRARQVASDPRIVVTDIETELKTQFTVDTISALKRRFPDQKFVWLMGGDNLVQLPRWRNWREIMRGIPIAIIARPGFTVRARMSRAARMFSTAQISEHAALTLPDRQPPAWVMIEERLHSASSTAIRSQGGWP